VREFQILGKWRNWPKNRN